ncbi:putative F-box domain, FBD domain, leucine-rich repeat domain, L domain-containing protein [Medicago truncatula]|uniref:Putative F-box domain, FBD domain, leucine-rich repeat domain, L domain-containing protein n=1 Tax=Medicago truncatula TaxID=3880 RepID=A0A396GDJ2_MEDTR|nr:putative F-box domain, FBD domain, leucine-rich repeat domain, L domain-containing protein [Medicago truncatula]
MKDSRKMVTISDLPDELLCHILSFLPTKIAFTTRVLSKRWTPLFHSLTVLRFDYQTVHDYVAFNRFCDFIDTLMLSPRLSNKFIKIFSLKCSFLFSDSDCHIFDTWVEAAKRLCIEEFHLSMHGNILNDTIFTCQTLVILKLDMLQLNAENLFVDLPKLKTLHLSFVRFKNQNVLQQLLNASPNLEDLRTYDILHMEHYENSALERRSSSLSKEWKYPNSVPECVSFHLRSCTILNFEGFSRNLRFASYILQNARLLQDMTIDLTTKSSINMLLKRSQIIEELSSCPRISPACKLSLK